MKKARYILALGCLLLLFGCREAPAAEVAEATAVPTPIATEVVSEAATEIPTEPATATTVPTNTATPTETATATAVPTDTTTPTSTAEPTEAATETAVPATSTTVPPAPVSAPPPAPAPAGPNLLSNPGFEFDGASWEQQNVGSPMRDFYEVNGNPQFVHSGQKAALDLINGRTVIFQRIESNIVPGVTYRAGVWVKIWSSSGEDRTVSDNPGDVGAQVCINVTGESDPYLDTSFCSGIVRPLDAWQFISVDGVAVTERLTIMLVSGFTGQSYPVHNEAIWDDATMGTAPSAATATPPPAASSNPVRPNPITFSPTALRDSMNGARSDIEQAGGLLDRLYNGEPGRCAEYQGYYDNIIRSATYSGVPEDWAGIYNDYIFAVEHFLATNSNIDSLCDGGGGNVSELNYGTARIGINDSLNRLIPAIEAANAKIGG